MPDISIVITNFNRMNLLDRSVRSCQDQIAFRRSFEIIIVDDASSDGSRDIIKMHEPEVVPVFLPKNLGVAGASNAGLAVSRGKYFMRVDSDDFLNKMAITYMSQILDENPDYDFVYCDHYRVDEIGHKQLRVSLADRQTLLKHGAGVLFRRRVLEDVGGYNAALRTCEDYDLLGRIIEGGSKGFHLPIALYRYHIHGLNLTLEDNRKRAELDMEKKYVSLQNR